MPRSRGGDSCAPCPRPFVGHRHGAVTDGGAVGRRCGAWGGGGGCGAGGGDRIRGATCADYGKWVNLRAAAGGSAGGGSWPGPRALGAHRRPSAVTAPGVGARRDPSRAARVPPVGAPALRRVVPRSSLPSVHRRKRPAGPRCSPCSERPEVTAARGRIPAAITPRAPTSPKDARCRRCLWALPKRPRAAWRRAGSIWAAVLSWCEQPREAVGTATPAVRSPTSRRGRWGPWCRWSSPKRAVAVGRGAAVGPGSCSRGRMARPWRRCNRSAAFPV